MYAVIEGGGKQYKVEEGTVLALDRVHGVKAGERIPFEALLIEGGRVRTGKVEGEVLKEEVKGPKVCIFKKRRRQNSRRKRGFRSVHTLVLIKSIQAVPLEKEGEQDGN